MKSNSEKREEISLLLAEYGVEVPRRVLGEIVDIACGTINQEEK